MAGGAFMIRITACFDYDTETVKEAYAALYRDIGPESGNMPFGPEFDGWESADSDWFDSAGKALTKDEIEEARQEFWKNFNPCEEWGIEQRRERAQRALRFYQEGGNDTATDVSDLLADIRHLCDAEGIDFHAESDRSYRHYIEEKEEENGS